MQQDEIEEITGFNEDSVITFDANAEETTIAENSATFNDNNEECMELSHTAFHDCLVKLVNNFSSLQQFAPPAILLNLPIISSDIIAEDPAKAMYHGYSRFVSALCKLAKEIAYNLNNYLDHQLSIETSEIFGINTEISALTTVTTTATAFMQINQNDKENVMRSINKIITLFPSSLGPCSCIAFITSCYGYINNVFTKITAEEMTACMQRIISEDTTNKFINNQNDKFYIQFVANPTTINIQRRRFCDSPAIVATEYLIKLLTKDVPVELKCYLIKASIIAYILRIVNTVFANNINDLYTRLCIRTMSAINTTIGPMMETVVNEIHQMFINTHRFVIFYATNNDENALKSKKKIGDISRFCHLFIGYIQNTSTDNSDATALSSSFATTFATTTTITTLDATATTAINGNVCDNYKEFSKNCKLHVIGINGCYMANRHAYVNDNGEISAELIYVTKQKSGGTAVFGVNTITGTENYQNLPETSQDEISKAANTTIFIKVPYTVKTNATQQPGINATQQPGINATQQPGERTFDETDILHAVIAGELPIPRISSAIINETTTETTEVSGKSLFVTGNSAITRNEVSGKPLFVTNETDNFFNDEDDEANCFNTFDFI